MISHGGSAWEGRRKGGGERERVRESDLRWPIYNECDGSRGVKERGKRKARRQTAASERLGEREGRGARRRHLLRHLLAVCLQFVFFFTLFL